MTVAGKSQRSGHRIRQNYCAPLFVAFVFLASSLSEVSGQVGIIPGVVKPGWNQMAAQAFPQFDLTISGNQLGVPRVPGLTVVKATPAGFEVNNYLESWTDPEMVIWPGESYFIRNPRTTNLTHHVAGAVTIRSQNSLPQGYSMTASIVPFPENLSNLQFVPPVGSRVYIWNNLTGVYDVFNFNGTWLPFVPSLEFAQGFSFYTPTPYVWSQEYLDVGGGPYFLGISAPPGFGWTIGQMNTMTYNANPQLGRVYDADGLRPVGGEFLGRFYRATDEAATAFVPTSPTYRFRDGTFAGYLQGGVTTLDDTVDGQECVVRLHVWEASYGSNYEAAVANGGRTGSSANMPMIAHATLGAEGPGAPPELANTFPNFSVSVGPNPKARFTGVARNGSQVRLRVILPAGESFRFLAATSLTAPQWNPVPGMDPLIGQGTLVEIDGPGITPEETRYYRLERD